MFRVGQKVVCVDADGSLELKEKAVYTIKKVFAYGPSLWRGKIRMNNAILLWEVAPSHSYDSFAPERFRPVQEKGTETGMAILRGLLTTKTVKDLVHD